MLVQLNIRDFVDQIRRGQDDILPSTLEEAAGRAGSVSNTIWSPEITD